jgi:Bacterial PH domain
MNPDLLIRGPGWTKSTQAFPLVGVVAVTTSIVIASLPEGWVVLGLLGGVATATAAALRARRIALIANPNGVIVRNYLRTWTLPWPEISWIGIAPGMLGRGRGADTWAVYLRRGASKRIVRAQATALGAERYLDELVAYAERHGWQADPRRAPADA